MLIKIQYIWFTKAKSFWMLGPEVLLNVRTYLSVDAALTTYKAWRNIRRTYVSQLHDMASPPKNSVLTAVISTNLTFVVSLTTFLINCTECCWHKDLWDLDLLLTDKYCINIKFTIITALIPWHIINNPQYSYSYLACTGRESPNTRQSRHTIQGRNPIWIKNRCS